MTDPDASRHVEVRDGDKSIAAADVTTAAGAEGTARASLHATPGHIPPGSRASLVDAVMDTPEVQASTRLEATVPLGDGESLDRLRQRTEDAVTRPAGSTALFDASIPPPAPQAAADEPASDLSGRCSEVSHRLSCDHFEFERHQEGQTWGDLAGACGYRVAMKQASRSGQGGPAQVKITAGT